MGRLLEQRYQKIVPELLSVTQHELFDEFAMMRSATFVGDLRIRLSRVWGDGPRALVIGCNPSTANAEKDDATSRWWNKWFRRAGFSGYDAANLYPFCTPHPSVCQSIVEAALPETLNAMHQINLPALVQMADEADQIFVCWGAIAWDPHWIATICNAISASGPKRKSLWCWGITISGAPKHPLARGRHRISLDQEPVLWVVPPLSG
jgi:hypothetical protein